MDHLGSTSESPRYEELDKPGIKTSDSPAKYSQHEIKEKQDAATEEKPQDLPQDQVESATMDGTSELTNCHLDHGLSKTKVDETRPRDDQHTYSCLQDGASKTDSERKHKFNNGMNITKEETIGHEYELISDQQLQRSREIAAGPSAADESHTTTAKDHFYHVLEEQEDSVESTADDEYMYVSTDRMSMNRKKNWKRLPSPSPKPDTHGHFYHILEGPTDTSDTKSDDQYYSMTQEPPHVIKETQIDEQQYAESLHPKERDVLTQQDTNVLFDDPRYQLIPPQLGAPEPEGLYSSPHKPDKKPMPGQLDHFYHTLEGPPGDREDENDYSTPHKPLHVSQGGDRYQYDEPLPSNSEGANLTTDTVLFDDPMYQIGIGFGKPTPAQEQPIPSPNMSQDAATPGHQMTSPSNHTDAPTTAAPPTEEQELEYE